MWFGDYSDTKYIIPAYWFGEFIPEPEPEEVVIDRGYVNGFYVEVMVTDVHGRPIGSLQGDVESITWKLNEAGQARITVPQPGTAAELIEFGNRLYIEFDNGLPPWSGYIDTTRRWQYGSTQLTAYSGEQLLSHRVTQRNSEFTAATAGGILRTLILEQAGGGVVAPGVIHPGGAIISASFHLESLDKVFKEIAQAGGVDFDVTGELVGGHLQFRINVYQRKGRDLPDVWLIEGHNVRIDGPTEQGTIINEWFAAGAGTGWGDEMRLYSNAVDETSVRRFSRRQGAFVDSTARDQNTLDELAAAMLAQTGDAYATIPLLAVNLPPAAFGDYGIGDGVMIELRSFFSGGYTGMRRVIGRSFRPRAGGCEVVFL